MVSSAGKSSTGAWPGPTAAIPWPLVSKPEAAARAGGAGDIEAAMAAEAASATVKKVAHRISGSRSNSRISRGTSKSSPGISRSNSSIRRDTSESSPRISSGTSNASDKSRNNSTSGISRDTSRSSPHSIQGDGVYRVFVSGVLNSGISVRVPCSTPTRFPDPYVGAQAASYSYFGDYADFGSGPAPLSQQAPAPPDPHGPPVPSESSSSSFA